MKTNTKNTSSKIKSNYNNAFHCSLKRLLIVPAIAVGFLLQAASGQTPIPIPNGNFTNTGNNETIGGSLLSGGTTKEMGTGPWSAQTHGTLGLLLPPTVTISGSSGGGFGEINNTADVLNYASIFQTLGQSYAANSTYTLNVTVSSASLLGLDTNQVLNLLTTDGVGIGFTSGGNTTSEGTRLIDSVSTAPIINLLSGNSVQISLSYHTGNTAPSGNIGVRLFANPTASVLSGVRYGDANMTVAAVPEPSTVVLACIFGCGMLLLLGRRKSRVQI